MSGRSRTDRNPGIEVLRFACALLVILIHTNPFRSSHDIPVKMLGDFINVMARVAVPFFFLTSGYFFQKQASLDLPGQMLRFARKMLTIYLAWFAIYTAFDLYWMHSQLFSMKRLLALLGFFSRPSGTSTRHLWFFPALLYCMALTVLSRRFLGTKGALALMTVIFVVGNFHPAWRSWSPRWAFPFYSAPFFFAGTFLADRQWPRSHLYLALALAAAVLQFPDFLARRHFWNVSVESYFWTTMIAVPCLFLFGLQLETRHGRVFNLLGSYSLGIYAVHLIFLYITGAMHWVIAPGMPKNILRPILITAASVITVFVLKKIPGIRKIC